MKTIRVKQSHTLLFCLAFLLGVCLFPTQGLGMKETERTRAGPSPRHLAPLSLRLPLPIYGFMHARVAGGSLPVYSGRLLEGEPLGWLAEGDFTSVEIYTQDVGKVIGSSAELFGGFVRLSLLEEIPDEHYASYEALFRAVILKGPLTGSAVPVWQHFDLTGKVLGTAMPGETVIAREDESGYSAEITLSNGLTGYVDLEHLSYIEPIEN